MYDPYAADFELQVEYWGRFDDVTERYASELADLRFDDLQWEWDYVTRGPEGEWWAEKLTDPRAFN